LTNCDHCDQGLENVREDGERAAREVQEAWDKRLVHEHAVALGRRTVFVCTRRARGGRCIMLTMIITSWNLVCVRAQSEWYSPTSQNNLGRARARMASFKQEELSALAQSTSPSAALKTIGTVVRACGALCGVVAYAASASLTGHFGLAVSCAAAVRRCF
jgi:hypothetical protein